MAGQTADAESRPRSPSPPGVQAVGSAASEIQSRILQDRDDEIFRLREQLRLRATSGSGSAPAGSDLTASQLVVEDNQHLKREIAQVTEALNRANEEPLMPNAAAQGGAVSSSSTGELSEQARQLEQHNNGLRDANAQLRQDLEKCKQEFISQGYGGRSVGSNSDAAPQARSAQQQQQPPQVSSVQMDSRLMVQGRQFSQRDRPPGTPLRVSPRSTLLPSRVVHLQRQLKEMDDDKRSLDEMLGEAQREIARLEARVLQLQEHQAFVGDDDGARSEDGSVTSTSHTPLKLGARLGGGASGSRLSSKEKKMNPRTSELAQSLLAVQREQQKLQEEIRQRTELLRQEREQWRQEREGLLADQRRRDKTEEMLKRQSTAVQERLEAETEQQDQPQRQSKGAAPADAKPQAAAVGLRSNVTNGKTTAPEMQIQRQTMELGRLHREMQRLEDERADACAKLLASKHLNHLSNSAPAALSIPQLPLSTAVIPTPSVPRDGADDPKQAQRRGRQLNSLSHASSSSSLGRGARMGGSAAVGSVGTHGVGRGSAVNTSDSLGGLTHPAAPNASTLSQWLGRTSSCGSSSGESSSGESSASRQRTQANLCVEFGDAPLRKVPGVGWTFRMRINAGASNWVGGFAIGVTLSKPATAHLCDRAARIPQSWVAGYWGRTFANGKESRSNWSPQGLRPGDEVAFLVGLEGECVVFVNDEERCRFSDPPVPISRPAGADAELTALIDVSAAAAAVTFLPDAALPGGLQSAESSNGQSVDLSISAAARANAKLMTGNVVVRPAMVGPGLPAAAPRPGGAGSGGPSGRSSLKSTNGSIAPVGGQQRIGSASLPVPPSMFLQTAAVTASPAAQAPGRRVPQLSLPLPVH